MSVVYGLIERNQGRIIVESKLGVGTTYRLYFERQLAPESRR
jgi:signal transduction histidine kinase